MSKKMDPDDPAYWMLFDGHTSSTTVYDETCYICNDPEFAQMGLPLCRECPKCKEAGTGLGHVAADDTECTVCGYDEYDDMMEQHEADQGND